MRDDLLFHYSQELTYLRYLGAEFAEQVSQGRRAACCWRPASAKIPTWSACWKASPSWPRAFTSKSTTSFREIVESLLSILYPYYLRPIPSAVGGASSTSTRSRASS